VDPDELAREELLGGALIVGRAGFLLDPGSGSGAAGLRERTLGEKLREDS